MIIKINELKKSYGFVIVNLTMRFFIVKFLFFSVKYENNRHDDVKSSHGHALYEFKVEISLWKILVYEGANKM